MRIPVIPLRVTPRSMTSSYLTFSGTSVAMAKDTVDYKEHISFVSKACGEGTPMVIVDVKGMQKDDIDPNVLRKIRSKGNELWLMTGVRDAGDMIDAFCGDVSKIMVPYHMTSDRLLKEMTELSDNCLPAIFMERDKIYMNGRKRDIREVVRSMANMNFGKIAVFNVSSEHDDRVYGCLQDFSDVVMPYVSSGEEYDIKRMNDLGFADTMASSVRLFSPQQ